MGEDCFRGGRRLAEGNWKADDRRIRITSSAWGVRRGDSLKHQRWAAAGVLARRLRGELMDSHFISEAFRRGCETSKCQMSAWKDSV